MIDPTKHSEDRNFVERMLGVIPGFKGYLEKEERRESDHLLRTWMCQQLGEAKKKVDAVSRNLLDAGQIDALPQLERVKNRIEGFANKVESAVRGYSGVFDLSLIHI